MSTHEIPDVPVWTAALEIMRGDDRITPQLEGFLNLAVAQGVMGGTLYLDVPNELTAAQINKRMRAPILEALAVILHDPEAREQLGQRGCAALAIRVQARGRGRRK